MGTTTMISTPTPTRGRVGSVAALLPLAVIVVGLVITVVAANAAHAEREREREATRTVQLEILRADVSGRLDQYVEVLYGLQGFFEAADIVTRVEFHDHLTSSRTLERLPGYQAIEWAPVVSRADREAFELAVRADTSVESGGYPEFAVKTDEVLRDLVVVDFVEPMVGNEAAFGFDLASNPVRLASVEEAADSGDPVATAPIVLVQEQGEQVGFLILLAVDTPGPMTVDGYVLAVFRVGDMLGGASSQTDVSYTVTAQGQQGSGDTVLFSSGPGADAGGEQAIIDVAGEPWRIVMAGADPVSLLIRPVVNIALAGLTVTLALALVSSVLQRARATAERRADRINVDLLGANKELSAATRRLAEAATAGKVGLWERGATPDISWSSDQNAALFGIPADEWHDLASLRAGIHADDRAEFDRSQDLKGALDESTAMEFRVHGESRRFRRIKTISRLIDDGGGEPYLIGATVDVTEDRERESALEALNDELAQFAYRASHDLKSPLTSSKGLLKYILADIGDGDLEEAKSNTATVFRQLDKLERLVTDILALAKADLGSEAEQEIDFESVFSDIVGRLEWLTAEQACRVTVSVDLAEPFVGEQVRFVQILENLVLNGVKYTDRSKDEQFVHASIFEDATDLHIVIEDNGVGIPEEHHHELFAMFKRFHPALSSGSGLGLSIVKKHIDSVSGEIGFTSSDQGTRFEIRVPKQCRLNQRRSDDKVSTHS